MCIQVVLLVLLTCTIAKADSGDVAVDSGSDMLYVDSQRIHATEDMQVRITAPGVSKRRIVGRLQSSVEDTIIVMSRVNLLDTTVWKIPIGLIAKSEVVVANRANTARGLLYGTLVGAGLGFIAHFSDSDNSGDVIPSEVAIPLLAALGGGIGTIFGALTKRPVWQEIMPDDLAFHMDWEFNGELQVSLNLSL